ncbi:hypothetical protein [Actinomadura rubrisoli]|uniref:Uncharacterized protein n=1 Tax=Actinomadura rubrisoli TaxID=2530368 RepID=A0A4V2YYM7_9ACTN|nr:hypothetical protein [Actinomadura rubrisoli]TDD93717.1 hypothetical protein E1298_08685 [Actinomadura rubrisoli]
MRFLVLLAMLALAAVVIVLVLYALGGLSPDGRRRTPPEVRWEADTESSGGVTTVIVRHVARDAAGLVTEHGRQTIAAIPDDAPDWEIRYHDAMAQARSRVAALGSEAD